MPGNVGSANPGAGVVMPFRLATGFVRVREWATDEVGYKDGRSHRRSLVTVNRRRWRLTVRLEGADLTALRDFYLARNGGQEEFWFYDFHETSPRFSYDLTGVATVGRYAVRFEMGWGQTVGMARGDVGIELAEVA